MQDDQTVMIRMLQAREAEIDLMRSLEQHYAGLRARMVEFEQRLASWKRRSDRRSRRR